MKNKGFTLIELLSVIAIVAILAAILIPMASGVREKAEETTSFSNLRQIFSGSQMYASENGGRVPPAQYRTSNFDVKWTQLIGPFLGGELSRADGGTRGSGYLPSEVFVSPRWEDSPKYNPDATWLWGYGMNFRLTRPDNQFVNNDAGGDDQRPVLFSQIPFPATTILVGESANWHFEPSAMDLERWNGRSHVLYADGRVESALPEKVIRLARDPSDR